jgi:hypothetical protein
MSLNSLQAYTANLLNGLESAQLPPAQAWVLPPSMVQAGEFPQLFVWGGSLDEQRATLPRHQGQKRITHTLFVWVIWISDNDIGNVQNFPLLLDAIRAVVRSVVLPVELTDATTGEVSQLTDFGERIQQEYATPAAMADQRFLNNAAQLKISVHEWINPA